MKLNNNEKRVLGYLSVTCGVNTGQRIWNVAENGLDDEYETKKVSQIMQGLKRKGLVNNYRTLWYLTQDGRDLIENFSPYAICKSCGYKISLAFGNMSDKSCSNCDDGEYEIKWLERDA